MKKIVFIAYLLMSCIHLFAQANNTDTTSKNILPPLLCGNRVYSYVEKMPEPSFSLMDFLSKNLNFVTDDSTLTRKTIVQFIVTCNGIITDIKILKSAGRNSDEQTIKLIKNMPKWKPGEINGQPVNVYYKLPIYFETNRQ